jgi:cellulose synthase/poly-beta-1,6-N-acetylglucosamine synthase-like glycosyltransferase
VRRTLFWGAGALLAYTYAGFPALVLLRGRVARRPYRTADIVPSITVVVAVHDEEAVIAAKLGNLLALDYPSDLLDVVIVSDGSTDRTNEIVRACADPRVTLLALPRVGKAEALNTATARARGEIVVFTDANSMFEPDAVRALVRPFADPDVGGVAGNQVYTSSRGGGSTDTGERGYWDFDRTMKRALSDAGSVTGATGAIYAIRRELLRPLRADVNDDLLNSLRVVAQGKRLIFAEDAVAVEPVVESTGRVFSRRVRVMTRGLRCVLVERELLDPRRHGFFSLQLFSHKVLMRTQVVPLAALAASSFSLRRRGRIYRAATVAQAAFYALGGVGLALGERPVAKKKAFAIPAFFTLLTAVSAKSLWELARGDARSTWEPDRGPSTNGASGGVAVVPEREGEQRPDLPARVPPPGDVEVE